MRAGISLSGSPRRIEAMGIDHMCPTCGYRSPSEINTCVSCKSPMYKMQDSSKLTPRTDLDADPDNVADLNVLDGLRKSSKRYVRSMLRVYTPHYR